LDGVSPAVVPGIGKGGSAWAAILIYGPLLGIMAFGMPETVLSRWGKLSMAQKPEQLDSLAFGMPKTFQKLR